MGIRAGELGGREEPQGVDVFDLLDGPHIDIWRVNLDVLVGAE